MNIYLDEQVAKDRIAEARAMAAQLALVERLGKTRRPLRVTLGHALIRMGHWMAGREPRRSHARRVAA